MYDAAFEQGPIRPPSEAHSLLVRVSRNCPWNRCAFCPVYKGESFSLRPLEDVLRDLDAMQAAYGDRPSTVFLQDANPLLTRPDDLVGILEGVYARFPRVKRITAYARAHTLAIRSVEALERIRAAGLHRLHVGLESGSDAVLELIDKGVTRARQIEGGRRAKAAGFELSEYVMPGIGGRELTGVHADDTASALRAIEPDFIRLRTTSVIPGTPLAAMQAEGVFTPLSEVETVEEIRRFLASLGDLATRLESDHMLNLLMELRGDLPDDRERLMGILDDFLGMSDASRNRFILARRMGWTGHLSDLNQPALRREVDRVLDRLEAEGLELETVFTELRRRGV
jgi:radical SAM superfamily enzyme